jgi:hypothetical protein
MTTTQKNLLLMIILCVGIFLLFVAVRPVPL